MSQRTPSGNATTVGKYGRWNMYSQSSGKGVDGKIQLS